ncbi:hypothetical protein ACLOJK_023423 [Asimina triloba]
MGVLMSSLATTPKIGALQHRSFSHSSSKPLPTLALLYTTAYCPLPLAARCYLAPPCLLPIYTPSKLMEFILSRRDESSFSPSLQWVASAVVDKEDGDGFATAGFDGGGADVDCLIWPSKGKRRLLPSMGARWISIVSTIEEDLAATYCCCQPKMVETGCAFDGFVITSSWSMFGMASISRSELPRWWVR